MADPVLQLIVGPNGAGKTTFFERVIEPATHLEFINADRIAAARWPGEELEHAYDAARLAASERDSRIHARTSFAAETVFSHESKLELLRTASSAGYRVSLHVVMIPELLAVARVVNRVANGGHDVPEAKVRARYARLWRLVREAIEMVDEAFVYDNSRARTPYRLVASFDRGWPTIDPDRPSWTPSEMR